MQVKTLLTWPILVVGLSLPGLIDCSDAKDLASGCSELEAGGSAVASLSIDAKFKAFVEAAADLEGDRSDDENRGEDVLREDRGGPR